MTRKRCTMCEKRIPVARLDAIPNAKTCGRACSLLRKKVGRHETLKRFRQRLKDAKANGAKSVDSAP